MQNSLPQLQSQKAIVTSLLPDMVNSTYNVFRQHNQDCGESYAPMRCVRNEEPLNIGCPMLPILRRSGCRLVFRHGPNEPPPRCETTLRGGNRRAWAKQDGQFVQSRRRFGDTSLSQPTFGCKKASFLARCKGAVVMYPQGFYAHAKSSAFAASSQTTNTLHKHVLWRAVVHEVINQLFVQLAVRPFPG